MSRDFNIDRQEYERLVVEAKTSEAAVARFLTEFGYRCAVGKIIRNPDGSFRQKYSDKGDVLATIDSRLREIEIKQTKNFHFTCAGDLPFRGFGVGKADKINSRPLPFCFVIVDKDCSHAAFHVVDDTARWFRDDPIRWPDGEFADPGRIPCEDFTYHGLRNYECLNDPFAPEAIKRQRIVQKRIGSWASQDQGIQNLLQRHDALIASRRAELGLPPHRDRCWCFKCAAGSRQHPQAYLGLFTG